MKNSTDIPVNLKFALTIKEASIYTGLPIRILRDLAKSDRYSVTVNKPKQGRRVLFVREALEEVLREGGIIDAN